MQEFTFAQNIDKSIFRDYYLVYPFDKATLSEIQGTVTIIGHEFAHQWFGNLVTCSRWKYLWLNEGFANYFQHYISSVVSILRKFFRSKVKIIGKNENVKNILDRELCCSLSKSSKRMIKEQFLKLKKRKNRKQACYLERKKILGSNFFMES